MFFFFFLLSSNHFPLVYFNLNLIKILSMFNFVLKNFIKQSLFQFFNSHLLNKTFFLSCCSGTTQFSIGSIVWFYSSSH
jgi:hypothetical protein